MKNAVEKSGFREIWLVVGTPSGLASVPCRVNIFTHQVVSFHMAFAEVTKKQGGGVSIGHYMEMLGAFLTDKGLGEIKTLWDGKRAAVFSRGVGCYIGPKLEFFPVTPRVKLQTLLGNEGCLFEPLDSHPVFKSIVRVCAEGPGWFSHIVQNPKIEF